jgi:DNA-binding response OmpR family regulator
VTAHETEVGVPKALVIHSDRPTLTLLEEMMATRYAVETADDLIAGIKLLAKIKPDIVVVEHDRRREEALHLLTYMRDHRIRLPVVVVMGPRMAAPALKLLKFGVRGFVEHPVDLKRLSRAATAAIKAHRAFTAPPPPITPEETGSNLSMLETRLNQAMVCFAGRNKVFIQSQLLGRSTTKPRICLKCLLRAEYGLSPNVFYEFIRDMCCGDPNKCEAYWAFKQERESA